ncbi:MAG: alcohol dehydrogenase catalytic domain-containing protein, partial [Halioglobus sp.]
MTEPSMKAMVLEKPRSPLVLRQTLVPTAGPGDVLLKVLACGICRTDLHVVDGDLTKPSLPLVPGHQIVGEVLSIGQDVSGFTLGQRVGVPWLGGSCGHCRFCGAGQENLCDDAVYTGYQVDGGFAEFTTARADYCFPIPDGYSDEQAAPLLCAGLIGYRAYRLVEHCATIGLYGFGAAAHILIQVARHQNKDVYAFTRPDDDEAQAFARKLGAAWAGAS